MQMTEHWVARWAGSDKFSGDFEEFATFEAAQHYAEGEVAKRKRNGEKYHMEVVRVTEVGFASWSGCGK